MNEKKRRTGFIAIVGLPNAGKSTLLNSLIKQKISIVSPKPQTTRDNILGVWTDDDSQIVFVDTPGAIRPKNALGEYMARSISRAVIDVDCIMLVIDGHDGIDEEELKLVKKYSSLNTPLVVVITKTDISQPARLMPELAKLNEYSGIKSVFAVSAKRNKNIDMLREKLKEFLPEGEMYFPEDEITDKTQGYLVCEFIREKILLGCEQEIPHGVGVVLNKMTYDEVKQIWDIDATIFVEKQSHKPIILGKHGQKIKENWRNSIYMLNQIGYTDN
jgi:GTP-binding protein Era